MRISDWSSDVCSSDLQLDRGSTHLVGDIDRGIHGGHIRTMAETASRPLVMENNLFGLEARYGRNHASHHGVKHGAGPNRSEEHTSELQSLMRTSYAVFGLKIKKPSRLDRKSTRLNS